MYKTDDVPQLMKFRQEYSMVVFYSLLFFLRFSHKSTTVWCSYDINYFRILF